MIHATPTFQTKRLILRPLEISDAPSYYKHFVDYEVVRQLSTSVPWPYPKDGIETFMKAVVFPTQGRDRWDWGICLKEEPTQVIGGVSLWRKGTPENRGFWLGKSFWGQGFMTEAVAPVQDFAFNELKFERLILSNAVGNLKSRRIKEKAGAVFIGTRQTKFVDSSITEAETWELAPKSWAASKTKI